MLPKCPKCGKNDQVERVDADRVIQTPQLSFLGRLLAATTGIIIPSVKIHTTVESSNERKDVKTPDAVDKYCCKSCSLEFTVISSD